MCGASLIHPGCLKRNLSLDFPRLTSVRSVRYAHARMDLASTEKGVLLDPIIHEYVRWGS